ncbi:hypothetical protein [Sphingomonas sp. VDB2]|uniref:hypothetical protein n=1 Tax=Sphingomonas sp. VDB2 TaxID=3228751 RepID=UPI003A8094DF
MAKTPAPMSLFPAIEPTEDSRVVSWFSCGAASAVATKLALDKYGDRLVIVYTDPKGEHEDNKRFLADCERWFGRKVIVLSSRFYSDPWDVMRRERYIVGPDGAKCTGEMKRVLRFTFQRPDDIQVFGYTSEEVRRADLFRRENFEVCLETPLIEHGLDKEACKAIVCAAGIELPVMYRLGFQNNNCIGCCKGGMGYWNMIRRHFPSAFDRMAKLEREIGASCCRETLADGTKRRVFLDELDPSRGNILEEPDMECSLMCHSGQDTA